MRYKEALAWLYSLQRFGIKLGLENIRRLIAELDVQPRNARVIHVAGTNGKGSVCAMIDSICRAGKYRTGLFISPHLVTFRERIRVHGEMISEEEVATGLTTIRDLVASWDPHPTFFEITTALALKHFAEAKTDVVILETGLGGRLDATNAVPSNVSVITPIALDHEKWLGDSIEKIASEKAGIIKPRTPVISAPQSAEAEKVIRDRATECEAPLQFVDQSYTESPIALRGEHQNLNAAIAIAAILAAKIHPPSPGSGGTGVTDAAIVRGLANVEWPARFQCWDKRTVIDGAHNPAAAKILAQTWRELFGDKRATIILAVLSDKDLGGICEALAPIADSFLLPKIRTERAMDPDDLGKALTDLGHQSEIAASFGEAFAKARNHSEPILITGSLHFAGEALAHLQGQPAAFEECGQ
ncbi:MAG TPA: folylpolyglutamate synthase/dihydrofolate synthase family protein [Chthoniobacterales bacterium]|nr:folylpolyglutamate synthase/dihydrofolate synthase family protein [Chthoniobacterales bacterium]